MNSNQSQQVDGPTCTFKDLDLEENISCPNWYYYNFAEYNPMYRGFMVQRDGAPGPFGEKGTDAVVGYCTAYDTVLANDIVLFNNTFYSIFTPRNRQHSRSNDSSFQLAQVQTGFWLTILTY